MFDKERYWDNRKAGKPGVDRPVLAVLSALSKTATTVRGLGLRKKRKNRDFTSPAHGALFANRARIKTAKALRAARRVKRGAVK